MAEFFQVDGFAISQEDKQKCQEAFDHHGVTGLLEYLELKREEWKRIPLNVAVVGISGSGKSTFINTIRDLKGNNDGAAKVGVKETTEDRKSYPHPKNKKLVFWDLPGAGTEKIPSEKYLEKIKFGEYDCYIIMTATRFLEIDAWLGEEIKKTGKPFYYIRSKIGMDVQNDAYENGEDHDVAKLINDIRVATMTEIRSKLSFEPPLFLIDSQQRSKYDFDELEKHILEDLPRQKSNTMALSLSAFSKDMIKIKAGELRRRAWYMAILSAGVAAIPVPGLPVLVDFKILTDEAAFYYNQFGLDEASLQTRAQLFSTDIEPLRQLVLKHFPDEINQNFIKSICVGFIHIGGSAFEEVVHFLPIVGALIAAKTSFAATRLTLGHILDKMETAALDIADFTEQQCHRTTAEAAG